MPPSTPSEPQPGPSTKLGIALRYALVPILLFLSGVAGAAAQSRPSEYDVKAAYLFNFGKFMHLSGGAAPHHPTFDICVLGHDPFGHVLDDITAKESIDNRPVRVVQVPDAYVARECDIVFISADEGDGIPADLTAIGKADVLTVSDAPEFIQSGGMIQFVIEESRVRFAVNLDAVNRTHLILSSELLRVASSIKGMPPPEEQQ